MRNWKRKVLLAFFAMVPLSPAAIDAAEVPPGQPFQALQGQVNGLQSGVTSIQGQVNGLQSSVTTLQSNVADIEGRVAALERITPQTFAFTCGAGMTLSEAVKHLKPGDILLVSGTCNEHVLIPEEVLGITLDGQGSATINGSDPNRPTVQVRGRDITVKGFTITGGETGIMVSRGTTTIDGNTIQSVGTNGINVTEQSAARIVNNTIQNNPSSGILVGDNSSARIGFLTSDDTVASPNIIQSNKGEGILVARSSMARIVGNMISNNGLNGIIVNRGSHADISSNTINGNILNGINVLRNSGVDLGADGGTGIFEAPNSTTVNNGQNGIRCNIDSYADRRLGTLNGVFGAKNFGTTFTVNVIPGFLNDNIWGSVDDVEDSNPITPNATRLQIIGTGITGPTGQVRINSEGCIDSLNP